MVASQFTLNSPCSELRSARKLRISRGSFSNTGEVIAVQFIY